MTEEVDREVNGNPLPQDELILPLATFELHFSSTFKHSRLHKATKPCDEICCVRFFFNMFRKLQKILSRSTSRRF